MHVQDYLNKSLPDCFQDYYFKTELLSYTLMLKQEVLS